MLTSPQTDVNNDDNTFRLLQHITPSNVLTTGEEEWARKGGGTCPPSGNVVKFCALVVTVKRSADQLFMNYFHHFSSVSGGFASRSPNLPAPGKNPAEAHNMTYNKCVWWDVKPYSIIQSMDSSLTDRQSVVS